MIIRSFTLGISCFVLPLIIWMYSYTVQASDLILAKKWNDDLRVEDYLVSEKLDGVRAYWDGKNLLFRSGRKINTPKYFLEQLPKGVELDGELWMGRGLFEVLSGIVRRKNLQDQSWKKIRYMIFELPEAKGSFEQRFHTMQKILPNAPVFSIHDSSVGFESIQILNQIRVQNIASLKKLLKKVVSLGGEGLMLHKATSLYTSGRSDDLLKLKPLYDAEAILVGYVPGKGKFKGLVGSLVLQLSDGKRFKVSSGLKDINRKNPPPIGSKITYRYHGFTNSGLPKFPIYLRVRKDF